MHGEGRRRTALYVVVVSLCAKLIKARQSIKANSFQFV